MSPDDESPLTCLYCDADPSSARGIPHVFPEAVVQNDLTLPRGVMCDACNSYLKKLDEALARHPAVADGVQRLGLPGKRGSPRRRVANIDRDPSDGVSRVDIGPLEVVEEDGKKVLVVKYMLDPKFDLRRFRRGLHMVALDYLAQQHGAARALDSQFDAVRSYIRGTRKGKPWPFLVCYKPGPLLKEIRLTLYEPDEFGLVGLVGIFNHYFYVDLFNTGNLGHWSLAAELPGAQFVGPGDAYPASPRAEAVPPRKRGQLRMPKAS